MKTFEAHYERIDTVSTEREKVEELLNKRNKNQKPPN